MEMDEQEENSPTARWRTSMVFVDEKRLGRKKEKKKRRRSADRKVRSCVWQ